MLKSIAVRGFLILLAASFVLPVFLEISNEIGKFFASMEPNVIDGWQVVVLSGDKLMASENFVEKPVIVPDKDNCIPVAGGRYCNMSYAIRPSRFVPKT